MNIKRVAYDKVIEHLRGELKELDYAIRKNKRKFQDLVNEQTALKRARTEIGRLIGIVEGDKRCEKKV